ncbi:hypothetical protein PoB_003963200 [Plakobranchus ocellatus]|uniref:Uncharacterized protein n=1 Tax=Plakobranchus ocellatus TaxID=259542 RepID=A0AAV4B201_9GAST|nr:hypothetical protein PoB_003963200 [Plakobranchus ocellatus]
MGDEVHIPQQTGGLSKFHVSTPSYYALPNNHKPDPVPEFLNDCFDVEANMRFSDCVRDGTSDLVTSLMGTPISTSVMEQGVCRYEYTRVTIAVRKGLETSILVREPLREKDLRLVYLREDRYGTDWRRVFLRTIVYSFILSKFSLKPDQNMFELMAKEAKRYAEQVRAVKPTYFHIAQWVPATVQDIKTMLALLFTMGLVCKPN